MKANELQIGDLVYGKPKFNGTQEAFRITSVTEGRNNGECYLHIINPLRRYSQNHVDNSDIEPIPLTAEMLKKNGFFVSIGAYPNRLFCNKQEEYCVEISNSVCSKGDFSFCVMQNSEFEPYSSAFICDCKYVHRLQHALRLVGLADIADNFKAE